MKLETIIVVFLFGGGIFMLYGAFQESRTTLVENRRLNRELSQIKSITGACGHYAQDYAGRYPNVDTANSAGGDQAKSGTFFETSTDAFNELIRETGLVSESTFFIKGCSYKIPPYEYYQGHGELSERQNCFIYVRGQGDGTSHESPLVASYSTIPGLYMKYDGYPGFRVRKVVVGFCGGRAKIMRLSEGEEATVQDLDRGVADIFQTEEDGGYLAVPRENILTP